MEQQPQRNRNNDRDRNYYAQHQQRSEPFMDAGPPSYGQRQYYPPRYDNRPPQQQYQNRRPIYDQPPRNDYFRQPSGPPPSSQPMMYRRQPQSSSSQMSQHPSHPPQNSFHNRDSPRHLHTNSGFRNNNNNSRHGPPRYSQSSHNNSSSAPTRTKREEQELKKQAQEREAEEFMRNLQCDNITLNDIKLLDITPAIYNELVCPGKAAMYLNQIITTCKNQFKKVEDLKTDYKTVNKDVWVCWLTMNWPEKRSYTAKASNKKDAKNLAALAAIHHLRTSNSIDSSLRVQITDNSHSSSFLDQTRGPVLVNPIPMSIKQQMMSFISKYDECIDNLIEYQITAAKKSYDYIEAGDIEGKHLALDEGVEFEEDIQGGDDANFNRLPANTIIDIFTSRPYAAPNDLKIRNSWNQLKSVFEKKTKKIDTDDYFYDMMSSQDRLPIRSLKSQIMSTLKNYRAIVIAGDTGCGKSTQVPQFILENFTSDDSNNQNYVNIAVTQPRRISAISLAERVATELGENGAGGSVGHQVRFDAKLPSRDINAVMFFTTGMLLRKLHRNADLKGITHLVIDEVHERDCTTDFLLILIKRLLTRRRDLRVIFMSASMDASLFSQYFDNCPVISVPGRCFPVQNIYLEEISTVIDVNVGAMSRAPRLNQDLIVQLIRHIDINRNTGAILCFMPGWKEMKALQKELDSLSDRKTRNKLRICMAHSKLPISEQRLIFGKAGELERKVILATNIAETSITINDVAFVIDSGLCNSIDYDQDLNMSTFGTRWISKANAKQRSGRAGRTCPGECFKLYRRDDEAKFQDFPNPELLRIPLESVIMEVKCHCPNEKSVTFLSQAIQHPSTNAINSALEELISLKVLDNDENLTILGKRISGFTTHPRLSVSLVLATALRCLYPILNASAMISSTQDPFLSMQTDKQQLRDTKKKFLLDALGNKPNKESANCMSDHIALASMLKHYDSAAMSKLEGEFFVQENHLNRTAMMTIQECRNLYANMLVAANFTNTYEWYSSDSLPNMNMDENEIVVSSLVQGFYPKIVRIIRGVVKNGLVYPNKISPLDSKSNQRVRLAGDSIVKNVAMGKEKGGASDRGDGGDSDDDSDYISQSDNEERKPNFITYLNSRMDQESGLIVIRDGSVVPPHSLLLFGGNDISLQDYKSNNLNDANNGNMVMMTLDRNSLLSFRMTRDDAIALREWRSVWHRYFDWFVHTKSSTIRVDSNDEIIGNTMSEFLKITKMVFNSCR